MFGGDPTPVAGFRFGDAVVVELLKERNKLPSIDGCGFDTVVFAMNDDLYGAAVQVASTLRENSQSVDLILENNKSKWVFEHASRIEATFCVIVGSNEYAYGERN
eukprot:CCRYP_008455-RA/>CCRYP_008455-RA protein AED:0.32 eAED:0.32 QI:0/-1/0/1/-1/1/1/0/104